VPSSNTVLEPLTQAIVASITYPTLAVSVHFSRLRVVKIEVSDDANAQFSTEHMVAAARLLADADVDVIGWSGTSAGWLGFDYDARLCEAIQKATGVPSTSSIQAMNRLIDRLAPWNKPEMDLGLVTPYAKSVNDAIRKNYAATMHPIEKERERYLGLAQNTDFAQVSEAQLDEMVEDVVAGGADMVAIFCTNLRGAQRAAHWERLHKIVVLDSVATTVWGMLQAIDLDPSCIDGWGSIFKVR